jgi:hypothetical protein
MNRFRFGPKCNHHKAHPNSHPHECGSHRLAAGFPPHAQVAHHLQPDGIKRRRDGGKVMGIKPRLHQHAGNDDGHADNQESNTAIDQYAAHHGQWREQCEAGKKIKCAQGLGE